MLKFHNVLSKYKERVETEYDQQNKQFLWIISKGHAGMTTINRPIFHVYIGYIFRSMYKNTVLSILQCDVLNLWEAYVQQGSAIGRLIDKYLIFQKN